MTLDHSLIERLIYKSELVEIGLFRCPPAYPDFHYAGRITGNLLVFPRTSVRITQAGREPVIANPNVVMYYNLGQPYRRDKVSERGDHCEWFSFSTQVVIDALSLFDRRIVKHPEQPFTFSHGPSDPASYLLQRRVIEHIQKSTQPDRLFVEEAMLAVLRRSLQRAFGERRRRACTDPVHQETVRAVQTLLATRYQECLTIERIAAEVNYSPYHLARIFREHTGITIHKFLNQVRLRTSLEIVADGGSNLTEVAMNLGYSSHSHFTQAFRKAFGALPSQVRDIHFSKEIQQLSKNLIA
jgi:AraC-like DNA-binding protein